MRTIYKTEAGRKAVEERYAAFLDLWPVPSERRHVATSQGNTFVISSGEKAAPDVVLLHGSSTNATSWIGDVGALSTRFHVHVVDMIGEPGFSAPVRPSLAGHIYSDWLHEVTMQLGIARMALVGISLGGWLALAYATRRPENVGALVLLNPGGIGRQRNVMLWAMPLLLLGSWGRQRIVERLSRGAMAKERALPELQAFGDFMDLIIRNYKPRTEKLPAFTDAELRHLTMPLLAILGAEDLMIDSQGTRDRLVRSLSKVEICWLPAAGHILLNQTAAIEGFLQRELLHERLAPSRSPAALRDAQQA